MRLPRRTTFWVLLLVATSGRGVGSPSEPVVSPTGEPRDSAGFTFRVSTPAVSLAEDSEGNFAIRIEGFGALGKRPEAPDLPIKVVRVAIPEGVVPRLETLIDAEDFRPGIRPRPVPDKVPDWPPGSSEPRALEVSRRSPSLYEGAGTYPEAVAWLGATGAFRDQRYVEVHLAPARFDRARNGIRVARSFRVAVHFDGDRGERHPPQTDPALEPVYRDAFVNYEQGMTFRLSGALSREALVAAGTPLPMAPADTTPRYKIKVRANGVVRLDYARMSASGFLAYPISSWKLTSNFVEVPLFVQDPNGNDLLENNPGQPEWVEFYGQALDFDPKTVLNEDRGGPTLNLYEYADVTDQNAYILTVEPGARARVPNSAAAPTGAATATDFEAVSHRETDDQWLPLGENDPWCWKPFLTAPASRTDAVPLPGLVSGTLPARILVRLRGYSASATINPDHRTRITLQYDSVPSHVLTTDEQTWDGQMNFTHDFTWWYPGTGNQLQDPVYVKSEALAVSGTTNIVIVDWLEVRYRRAFLALGDQLSFDYPNGEAEFEIGGFASGPLAPPAVYEITAKVGPSGIVSPVRLTGAAVAGVGPYSVRFHVLEDPSIPPGTPRRFVVAGAGGVSVPADPDFTAIPASDLRSTANQADLIVISRPEILGPLSTGTLNQLLALRLGQQGITSKIVALETVENEFGGGVYGPSAIRNFLKWVMSTAPGEGWASPKPAYVLLIGDGSYDSKHNEASTPVSDYVPTVLLLSSDTQLSYLSSDNALAAVVGTDHLADLVVGRIAARSDAEANAALTKIYNYETFTASGNWTRRVMFISDRGHTLPNGTIDPTDGTNFEATNTQAISLMKQPPYTNVNLRYWSDYCGVTSCNRNKMTSDIKAAVNGTGSFGDGAAVVQFVGHGNFNIWSDDYFFDEGYTRLDVNDLTNSQKLPWLITLNCLTSGFHTTQVHTMGEDWLKSPIGGAVAVSGPSGMMLFSRYYDLSALIFDDLFGARKERALAVTELSAISRLCGDLDYEACQGWTLLGDPAQRLAVKAVAPATAVTATAGNAVVDLSWQASSTPGAITYEVWRTENVLLGYARVAQGLTATTYADTSVSNAKTYYYYLVALDAEQFESRFSNFNSDCAVSGPDCVKATPLNPNPPAVPTGLAVVDLETSGRLGLSWNANAETDLKNYTVHYGTAPGAYTVHLDAGKVTSFQIASLENNVRYYIALTATNTSLKTSGYSLEQSGVPTYVRGVRSPGFVGTLLVDKSGSSAVLSWSPVTTDIYGKPATIARYEVYRALSPTFSLATATLLGTPTGTSFTDVGALAVGAPNYDYVVRAIDVAGNPGGLGTQLPNGIDALSVDKSAGHVVLSWPAVTTTFDPPAWATVIDHYEVYASATRFSRADIRNGTVSKIASVTGTSADVGTPASTQYYSVISVDSKGNLSPF